MRIGRTILGLVCIVVGALTVTIGVIGVSAFGSAGKLEVTSSRLTTDRDAYALVADVQGVSAGFPGSQTLGTTTIGASSVGGKRLFVGLATGKEVNDYLFGVPFEAVRQNGSTWETLPVPGLEEAAPPATQKFWLRKSTGPAPSFEYTGGTGTSSLVIMNADGRPSVNAAIRISYVSSSIFPLSLAAIALGALLVLFGLFVLWRARRRPARAAADGNADPAAEGAVLPAQPAAADTPTAPTPVQRVPAPEAVDVDVPQDDHDPQDRVTFDVTESAGGADPDREPAAEALPDDWFRRSDANQ